MQRSVVPLLRRSRWFSSSATGGVVGSTTSEKIVASVLFERLPVVIPKIEPIVYAFQEFSFRWTQQYRRKYPDEFLSRGDTREALEEYGKATEVLAFKLLELIALTLNLPAKRLNGFFKNQTTFMRLNHYPPCPSPDLALGVGRHKDAGALTVLTLGVGRQ